MYDCRLKLLEREKQYRKRKRLKKILMSLFYLIVLTLAGLGFNTSYAIFSTYVRTPVGGGDTADAKEILDVSGSFDLEKWFKSEDGESGFVIKNVSPARICVFFSIEGSLREAVQHIDPVVLKPEESYEVPIRLARVSELGLLEWRNSDRIFQGKIIARVLNDYAAYEMGTVTLSGKVLYEKAVSERDDPEGRIAAIRSVKDILNLCAEIVALSLERDQLRAEVERLEDANRELWEENCRLRDMVDSLQGTVGSLRESLGDAKKLIEELDSKSHEKQNQSGEASGASAPQAQQPEETPPDQSQQITPLPQEAQ
ncbi:MAG: hypothetical protein ACPLTR_11040, partial [Thermacetogeniaceae bacterium]